MAKEFGPLRMAHRNFAKWCLAVVLQTPSLRTSAPEPAIREQRENSGPDEAGAMPLIPPFPIASLGSSVSGVVHTRSPSGFVVQQVERPSGRTITRTPSSSFRTARKWDKGHNSSEKNRKSAKSSEEAFEEEGAAAASTTAVEEGHSKTSGMFGKGETEQTMEVYAIANKGASIMTPGTGSKESHGHGQDSGGAAATAATAATAAGGAKHLSLARGDIKEENA